ncbi:uncharacterized protein [Leptinotarsa decemlineata]|uniref:uncharacterized protein n=1 Tax=Leptinotarsa decemlineata TaxID=7539 RepID=UPI000C25311B|nr:uncharacterized protein LOC111504864 [Leptinotarsa decemlineata]
MPLQLEHQMSSDISNCQKFDGDVRKWIGFWGQFRKIHEDTELDNEDKFQYLVQSMEPGSVAKALVDSFPPSTTNYEKAVDQLKARFTRDEFLIEVYVRELLNLVLKQATNNKSEDFLRAWEKHRSNIKANNLGSSTDESINYLNTLLNFLRSEVESEERISLAKTSFAVEKDTKNWTKSKLCTEKIKYTGGEPSLYTTATIFPTEKHGKKVPFCLFCEGKSHSRQDYIKARSFFVKERKEIVLKKKVFKGWEKLGILNKYILIYRIKENIIFRIIQL